MFRSDMNPSPKILKARRNLRALFVLAILLTLPLSGVGGYFLFVGNSHPDVTLTLPAWEYGEVLMFSGLLNLFVYVLIFVQVRGLIWETRDENAA